MMCFCEKAAVSLCVMMTQVTDRSVITVLNEQQVRAASVKENCED